MTFAAKANGGQVDNAKAPCIFHSLRLRQIKDAAVAQREMRTVYLNAAPGQMVSALVWSTSAALSTWVSIRAGIPALVFGGMFI